MKVIITSSAKSTYWYADKIGDEFDVVEHLDYYQVALDPFMHGVKMIDKSDCQPIENNAIKRQPTRASRNAGGGKQSRPALRKARNVVRNKACFYD